MSADDQGFACPLNRLYGTGGNCPQRGDGAQGGAGDCHAGDGAAGCVPVQNAMGVGIPGADERGVDLCVALGITAGDADAGMNALHTVTAEQLAAAKALRGCVKVEIVDGVSGLYIETILRTDCDAVRVVTVGAHDHIALVEHAPFTEAPAEQESVEEGGAHCGSLAEFIAFADTVALDKLAFLRDALTMNRTIYDRAMSDELAHCVLPKSRWMTRPSARRRSGWRARRPMRGCTAFRYR